MLPPFVAPPLSYHRRLCSSPAELAIVLQSVGAARLRQPIAAVLCSHTWGINVHSWRQQQPPWQAESRLYRLAVPSAAFETFYNFIQALFSSIDQGLSLTPLYPLGSVREGPCWLIRVCGWINASCKHVYSVMTFFGGRQRWVGSGCAFNHTLLSPQLRSRPQEISSFTCSLRMEVLSLSWAVVVVALCC